MIMGQGVTILAKHDIQYNRLKQNTMLFQLELEQIEYFFLWVS